MRVYIAVLPVAQLMIAIALNRASPLLAAGVVAMSIIVALPYWSDKEAARRGDWRISEATLHLVDLFGGLPGGLVAQQVFRHKTAKPSFANVTWSIALVQSLVLVALSFGLLDWGAVT